MADYSPTIIAASLNDNELKTSIDKLVKYVGDQSLKMAQEFDAGVQLMKESLKSFDNIKQSGGNSRAKLHDEATKSIEREVNALDNLARATSRSVGRKEIRHDYFQLDSDIDKQWSYIIDLNKDVDAQLQHMIEHEQKLIQEKEREAQVTREIQQAQDTRVGVSGKSLGWGNVHQMETQSRSILSQQTNVKTTTASYSELEKVVATYLGVSEQELNLQIKKSGSYNALSSSLKNMRAAYAEMTQEERSSGAGKNLAENIQKVQRAVQQAQAQMNRPASLNAALGLNEKTLDDIAYKIQMLQRYRSGLDIKGQADDFDIVNKKIAELNKTQSELIGKNKGLLESNNALARSWNYMKNRLAFYFTVGASTAFLNNLVNVRSQYELLERSMGILFDSMQTGTKIFAELNSMALKSPFTTIELGSAAKQLSAYNIAAKDVVDTTKRLADMAAAVGLPIERLTYALGQIKSYGYLNSRDQRMFANAGIPLVQSLADMYTKLEGRLVSMGDVYDRIKKKQVSFEDTMRVINEMTDEGGRFFDFQAKSADTLKVRLANLTLAWNNMLNDIGKSEQGMMSGFLGGAKFLFENWRKINNVIVSIITELGIFKGVQLFILALNNKLLVQKEVELVLGKKITQTIWSTVAATKALAANPMTWVATALTATTYLFMKWRDLNKATSEYNKSISKNAQENIDSIDKFYSQYGKDVGVVTSLQVEEQAKLWERVRDEIEKTSKNAKQYIDILESTPNLGERVSGGSDTLSQLKIIEQEAKNIADKGYFSMGGGFASDDMAERLVDYDKAVTKVTKSFSSLNEASDYFRNHGGGWYDADEIRKGITIAEEYVNAASAASAETIDFISALDKADLSRIMGGGDAKTQLANIREFANIVRDNFLATEKGQKIGIEGQAKLNSALDKWIARQAESNNLLNQEQLSIEIHRSAWEKFFDTLNGEEKKRIDYLIRTNQIGGDEFKKIWDNAAEHLKRSSETSYQQIQAQIADLRGTAPIVIDVIYRERREKLDAQQEKYEADLITPKYVNGNGKVVTAEEYYAEEAKLRAKYGRFNKKSGEDNVDWEKRLGEEYQSNVKKLESLNNQLKNSAALTNVDREAKEAEKQALVDTNNVLKQIENREGFDYSQFLKGGKSGIKSQEDVLGDALSKELQLIQDIQRLYKEYTKAGISMDEAKNAAAKEYENTLKHTNETLSKFGIQGLSGEALATMDLRDMRDYYQSIIDKVQSSPKAVEALEKAIRNLNVELTKEGQKTIVDSLNSQLSKIKDEYEIAVELDASPELGSAFAEAFDLGISEYPHTIDDAISRAQGAINKALGKAGYSGFFDILKGNTDELRDSMGQSIDSNLISAVEKAQKEIRSLWKKDAQETISGWDKLLEKYAEYEYKRKKIMEDAERERQLARKRGATDELINAINTKERRDLAKNDFERYQQSPEWITATGDLATLTDKAISILISDLEKYKASAKNLDPKQIKQINNALKSLYREQRKGNPFLAIANALDEAKSKAQPFIDEVERLKQRQDELTRKRAGAEGGIFISKEELEELDELPQKIQEAEDKAREFGKVSATQIVEGIQGMVGAINQVTGGISDMFAAFGNTEASENIKKVSQVLEKAGSFAAMGAQVGGGWGAAIGGILGGLFGGLTAWADEISGNASITKRIESSERAVKRLQNAYIDLEHAVEDSYGTEEYYLQKLANANKRAQLEQLKRQLYLEQSRSQKRKDQDKILELQGQIKELEYEISNNLKDIVNDFMGISSVGDAIEDMVGNIIDALRSGENAMSSFDESIDDMIANMVKKLYSEKILGDWFEDVWGKVEQDVAGRTSVYERDLGHLESWWERLQQELADQNAQAYTNAQLALWLDKDWWSRYGTPSGATNLREYYERVKAYLEEAIQEGSKYTLGDIQEYADLLRAGKPILEGQLQELDDTLRTLGLMNGSTTDKLSNLQQGIQGITEDTAGALEAYMNGVSQQVYLHSTLLTEIRDAVVGFNMDVQLGVQSQILLELQNSYQVQMAIQGILQGWSSANGLAVRVEMV